MKGLMRTKCTLFAGTAVLLSLAAATPAQTQGYYPSGSYTHTCTNIQAYGGQLTADCRRMDGSWDRTSLDVSRCASGVANTDGRLTCGHAHWQGYGGGYQPYGGYNYGR